MPSLPIPWLSRLEDRVLRQIAIWEAEYEARLAATPDAYSRRRISPPTTRMATKFFKLQHEEMLKLLNRLEAEGLIYKERRLSAGLYGNGYDGSLYSEVRMLPKGRKALADYP